MNLLVSVFFVLSVLATTQTSANSVIFDIRKISEKCKISQNIILSPGESIKDPKSDCQLIICSEYGVPTIQDCGPQKVHGCKDYINKNRPFPDCCARHTIC